MKTILKTLLRLLLLIIAIIMFLPYCYITVIILLGQWLFNKGSLNPIWYIHGFDYLKDKIDEL